MKKIIFITGILALCLQLQRCNIINPKEGIPSYIHIDSFILKGNYDSVGSLSHKITDVWVTVDNEFIGVFELPATFPVLKTGTHNVIIRAGIYENGISLTRLPYTFYMPETISVNLQEKKIDTLHPVVYYQLTGIKYEFNEDFEHSNLVFKKGDKSLVDVDRTDSANSVFEGKYSMKAVMDTGNNTFEMVTKNYYNIPRLEDAYVELNYKSDLAFQVGYYVYDPSDGSTVQHLVLNLNPSATWKKIYVDYGSEISYEQSQKIFKIYISAIKTDNNPVSSLYLDNIKLICFE